MGRIRNEDIPETRIHVAPGASAASVCTPSHLGCGSDLEAAQHLHPGSNWRGFGLTEYIRCNAAVATDCVAADSLSQGELRFIGGHQSIRL
jgi:hypothetical protein